MKRAYFLFIFLAAFFLYSSLSFSALEQIINCSAVPCCCKDVAEQEKCYLEGWCCDGYWQSSPCCNDQDYTTCSEAYDFGTSGGEIGWMCGSKQYFKVTIPSGQVCNVTWTIVMSNSNVDYDLYVKKDSCPTTMNYDCSSVKAKGATDSCTLYNVSGDVTVYAMVNKYWGNGGYNISVSLSCSGDNPPSCSIKSISENSNYAFVSGNKIWYNPAVSGSYIVSVDATDDFGINYVEFPDTTSDGGNDNTAPYEWTYYWYTSSTYSGTATVYAYDTGGQSASCSFEVEKDDTPPTTTASISGGPTYYISLSCSDSQSGCYKTYYCINSSDSCSPSAEYSSPIPYTCNYCCYVRYYSKDNVNKIENIKSTSFGPYCGCSYSNPSLVGWPSTQHSRPGTTLIYHANITNMDSSQCPDSTFNLSLSCPSGWTCKFDNNQATKQITLSPGDTTTEEITVTSSSSASPGEYTITLSVTNAQYSSYSSSINFTYKINPCTLSIVSYQLPSSPLSSGDTATHVVSVNNTGDVACYGFVQSHWTDPSGDQYWIGNEGNCQYIGIGNVVTYTLSKVVYEIGTWTINSTSVYKSENSDCSNYQYPAEDHIPSSGILGTFDILETTTTTIPTTTTSTSTSTTTTTTTIPTTTIPSTPTVSFTPNSKSWTNKDVRVTVKSSGENPIRKTYYKLLSRLASCPSVDDTSYNFVYGNKAYVLISQEGEWKICAYAEDVDGNKPSSPSSSGTYRIDKTPPTITSVTLDKYEVEPDETIYVTTDGDDALSGVKRCTACWSLDTQLDQGDDCSGILGKDCKGYVSAPSKEGSYYLIVVVEDKAGNENYNNSDIVTVRASKPCSGINITSVIMTCSQKDKTTWILEASVEGFYDYVYVTFPSEGKKKGDWGNADVENYGAAGFDTDYFSFTLDSGGLYRVDVISYDIWNNKNYRDCQNITKYVNCTVSEPQTFGLKIVSVDVPSTVVLHKHGNEWYEDVSYTVLVNHTGVRNEDCYAYVVCSTSDPNHQKHHHGHGYGMNECKLIHPGETITFSPTIRINKTGEWRAEWCAVYSSPYSTCSSTLEDNQTVNQVFNATVDSCSFWRDEASCIANGCKWCSECDSKPGRVNAWHASICVNLSVDCGYHCELGYCNAECSDSDPYCDLTDCHDLRNDVTGCDYYDYCGIICPEGYSYHCEGSICSSLGVERCCCSVECSKAQPGECVQPLEDTLEACEADLLSSNPTYYYCKLEPGLYNNSEMLDVCSDLYATPHALRTCPSP